MSCRGAHMESNVLTNQNRLPTSISHIFVIMGSTFYVRGGSRKQNKKMVRDNPENRYPISLCDELDSLV